MHAISGIQYVKARAVKLSLRLITKLYCSSPRIRALIEDTLTLTEGRCPLRLDGLVNIMRKVKENLVTNQIHILTPTDSCFRLQPSFNFKDLALLWHLRDFCAPRLGSVSHFHITFPSIAKLAAFFFHLSCKKILT
ncbi:hypothetical protein GE061_006755 [Apolygus lucorum]|uniref:Uncharacterized protein n=1 Tax=Apolygus lucorum TaxID=248454 RepID=A0A8S9WQ08_APOLU|nr:hypothetical protein GE061_006755 [Apolygus lucorum]